MADDSIVKKEKKVGKNSRKHYKYRSNTCLNCSQPLDLSDVYCPYCSQLNSTKQLSLKDFFGEFFNSIVSYDSRLRYTISDLLFKPGTITRRYVGGKRLRYANPFRFFLSVSIIYFLLSNLITSISPNASPFINVDENKTEQVREELQEATEKVTEDIENNAAKVLEELNENDSELNEQIKKNVNVGLLALQELKQDSLAKKTKDSLAEVAKEKKKEKEKPFVAMSEAALDTINWSNRIVERFVTYNKFYEQTEIKDVSVALDSMGHKNTSFNRWVYNKNKTIDKIKEEPYVFMNYVLGKVPFFIFFFTPVFALFFWLIYSNKKYSYVEHMIFIFHIFSFLFLAMLIALIPDALMGNEILVSLLFMFIGPFYFYKALRNFYKQGRLITIVKFIFLNFVFLISVNIAALLFFAVTAAVY